VVEHIVKTKDLPSDDDMNAAINDFKKTFVASE